MSENPDTIVNVNSSLDKVLVTYFESIQTENPTAREDCINKNETLANQLNANFEAEDFVSVFIKSLRNNPVNPAGKSMGNYAIESEIGRGGMGVVYLARDNRLNRMVALKIISLNRSLNADDIRRFQNEAESTSQLDHPSIVPVYEYGEHDGQLYYAMKWIAGTSLNDWRDCQESNGNVSFDKTQIRIAEIVRSIADAIHHAHQRGILHRDLKPSNILVDHEGRAYVVDFGLAKQIKSDLQLTQTSAILGTPAYLAPELLAFPKQSNATAGRASRTTTAVDIYGLGAVLYFLLAGRSPFQSDSVLETLAMVRDSAVPSPRIGNPNIHADLDAVCRKCMEKDPALRYSTAAERSRWLSQSVVST